jgi:starvation-inducible DNA-binding protein
MNRCYSTPTNMRTITKSHKNNGDHQDLTTPNPLPDAAIASISKELRRLLADVFTLYLKTKNFHWHMSGAHFRDYHLLLDEQAGQLFGMTDEIAERARKIGGTSLRSIGDIAGHQRLADNDAEFISARDMLAELHADNSRLSHFLRQAHEICDLHDDIATASLIENWVDEAERRAWFLAETVRES